MKYLLCLILGHTWIPSYDMEVDIPMINKKWYLAYHTENICDRCGKSNKAEEWQK